MNFPINDHKSALSLLLGENKTTKTSSERVSERDKNSVRL